MNQKRRLLWGLVAALAVGIATAVPAAAGSENAQHYGPFASASPDSGTCGNNWANDLFDRDFTVHSGPDGAFTVVEEFKAGLFTTVAGMSPGGCQTNPGGTVNAGVTGSFHGYFIIALPAGTAQISADPSCVGGNPSAPCTTTDFINTHFTPCYPVTCSANTFFFQYVATDQNLLVHEWRNASLDRGGNSGDIASA